MTEKISVVNSKYLVVELQKQPKMYFVPILNAAIIRGKSL